MNEIMQQILADKAANRKRLAALPFEQKLSIMEKLRDRAITIAGSQLRMNQPRPLMMVSVDGVVLRVPDANIKVLRQPVVRPFVAQPNTPQTVATSKTGPESQVGHSSGWNPESTVSQ